MAGPPPARRIGLRVLFWVVLLLLVLIYGLPSLLVDWPPRFLERPIQREKIRERVKLAGGWDAIRRACVTLAEQNTNGFRSYWHDTNSLPPTIVVLNPLLVDYDPHYGRVSMRIFGIHSTGGHSTPYFGLEVLTTSKSENYKPGVGYEGGVIGNYHSAYNQVADGIYEIY
jgi:hypothetical protein